MEQILFLYFIRVVVTLTGGYYLSSSLISSKVSKLEGLGNLLHESRVFKGGLGILSLLVGIVSLFTGYFIGDFFPSMLNIVVALIVLYEYQGMSALETENKVISVFRTWMVEKQLYWGLASLFFGFIHLFFAQLNWI